MNIENELILYSKYKLTPNEVFIIQVILNAIEENNIDYLVKFSNISSEHKQLIRTCLQSCQDKGIILKSYIIPKEGETFIPEDVEFNKNFIKNLYKASFDMGIELYNEYPQFTTINSCVVPIRGVAKKFNSLEDFYSFYGKTIRWNPEKHNEIIELIKWAKDKNILQESIASFVINQDWIMLKSLKEGKGDNINYDAIKLL
jgi:hypothetical protein